jgi:hypothetical protein
VRHVLEQLAVVGQAGGEIGGEGLARGAIERLAPHRDVHAPLQCFGRGIGLHHHVLHTAFEQRRQRGFGWRFHQQGHDCGIEHGMRQCRPVQQLVGRGRSDQNLEAHIAQMRGRRVETGAASRTGHFEAHAQQGRGGLGRRHVAAHGRINERPRTGPEMNGAGDGNRTHV